MKRSDLTEKLLDIKREKGWTWKHITTEIGGMSEVLVVGACLGQMKMTKPQCEKAGELFGLSEGEKRLLNEVYVRHTGRDYDTIERTLDRDHFMSAEEAKEFGIVDNVIAKRPDEKPEVKSVP